MSAERAPQIVAGALVAEASMRALAIDTVDICPWALREGLDLAETRQRGRRDRVGGDVGRLSQGQRQQQTMTEPDRPQQHAGRSRWPSCWPRTAPSARRRSGAVGDAARQRRLGDRRRTDRRDPDHHRRHARRQGRRAGANAATPSRPTSRFRPTAPTAEHVEAVDLVEEPEADEPVAPAVDDRVPRTRSSVCRDARTCGDRSRGRLRGPPRAARRRGRSRRLRPAAAPRVRGHPAGVLRTRRWRRADEPGSSSTTTSDGPRTGRGHRVARG